MAKQIGKVVQVIGPVVDVRFEAGKDLPNIYDALHIKREDGSVLILEAQQLTGEDTVRAISMDTTDGLSRGAEVEGMGQPISMPVGDDVKGRLFNVVGAPIDGMKPVSMAEDRTPSTANPRSSRTSPPAPRSCSPGSR